MNILSGSISISIYIYLPFLFYKQKQILGLSPEDTTNLQLIVCYLFSLPLCPYFRLANKDKLLGETENSTTQETYTKT